jgi:hypothetical protein
MARENSRQMVSMRITGANRRKHLVITNAVDLGEAFGHELGLVASDFPVYIVFDAKNPFTGDCCTVFGRWGKRGAELLELFHLVVHCLFPLWLVRA